MKNNLLKLILVFEAKFRADVLEVYNRKTVKVDNLRFYRSLSWQDKDVAGVVDAGLGFAIDVKVSANGLYQYKIHKNKGKTYYVTGNQAYIYEIRSIKAESS